MLCFLPFTPSLKNFFQNKMMQKLINFDSSMEILKNKSYPYYFCLLMAPASVREQLALFWSMAAEIRFIPLHATNPLIGFIRLTHWREFFLKKRIAGKN